MRKAKGSLSWLIPLGQLNPMGMFGLHPQHGSSVPSRQWVLKQLCQLSSQRNPHGAKPFHLHPQAVCSSVSSSAFWPFPTETAQSCPGSSRRHSPTCNQEPNHCFSSSKDALPHITAVGTGRGAQCCVPLLHHLTARFNECLCWSALIAVILQGLEVVPLTFYLQTAPSFPRVIRG